MGPPVGPITWVRLLVCSSGRLFARELLERNCAKTTASESGFLGAGRRHRRAGGGRRPRRIWRPRKVVDNTSRYLRTADEDDDHHDHDD